MSNSDNPYYTSNHDHQWMDQNGWLHRTANVINAKNGNIYNLTFDIAKAKDGRHILYATKGKIKKVGNAQVNSLIKGAVYMVMDPEQIKSADPIAYDDDGNVIPLSERFNKEKEDIRYSLSGQEDIGPVREDLQTEEDAEGEYDDLPFEFLEGLDWDGEYSGPVTTVAQRLGSKTAALRRELAANEQNRKASGFCK